ncbi:uncharacterized protein ACHE_40249A [Aspergillus chevalieri]|uniref:Xylanolytic transcriptional activator regulatory domain-containing protein n=1 Tax=Aspergillus chevalieri TaxID=182096 RepID=A0A7R7VN78_ASPCH|nr:uncharacterized protein ACHE_40249A [Aspergillus chevalieri]BCR87685.1 hypothetical protein ACHE_40249A [Aspergillus chevalieri]
MTGNSSDAQDSESRNSNAAFIEPISWGLPGTRNTPSESVEQQGQSTEYQSAGDGSLLDAYDPLQDFEYFSHSLGLTSDWALPSEFDISRIMVREPIYHLLPTSSVSHERQEYSASSQQNHPLTQFPVERDAVGEFGVLTFPVLKITEEHRSRLLQSLVQFQTTVTNFVMPSPHSLTRFVNAFFDGFYPHAALVHIPTFKLDNCDPEIILAMAALGAQYRHEYRKGTLLFYAAKAILQDKALEMERKITNRNLSSRTTEPLTDSRHDSYNELMREARCALYLIFFATWHREPDIVREAFNLQSFLARCVRESRLYEDDEALQNATTDWHVWVEQESQRRIKLFSFAFLNLQSIAFNVPPVILSDEINLRLPCSCMEWLAPSYERWATIRGPGHQEQMRFQDALAQLARISQDPSSIDSQPVPSTLANYILLHALIQRILLMYQAFHFNSDGQHPLLLSQKDEIRNSLRAWTSQWQRAPESSLDPRNPNGPVPFTSTVLLGLAYIRLAFNIGSYGTLRSRDPEQIANKLLDLPRLPGGPHLLPAILHATHALSIPVKLGISFVSRGHTYVSSIQHSLCGMEFAVFISKWLHCISECRTRRSLDEHEIRLINWISDIVEEGRTSGDEDLCPGPVSPSDCLHLAYAAVKLWARLIKGNEQWAILRIIGESLDIYADLCKEKYTPILS